MDKLWLHYIIIEIDDIQNRTGRVVQKEKRFLNTTKYTIWFNGELLNMFQSTSISNFKNTSAELPK